MSKPFIVGISGGSGSGKTTILQYIHNAFNPEDICVISQDNYYKPVEEQEEDEHGVVNFDLPTSIDKNAFVKDLKALVRGETIERLEYTFNNPLKIPRTLHFEPRPIILLEGIFIFHFDEIMDLLDLKVFLHARSTTAFARRIRRDKIERNYPLEDVLYRFDQHAQPTYERYISPFKERADIVINNNTQFERAADVLIAYLKTQV